MRRAPNDDFQTLALGKVRAALVAIFVVFSVAPSSPETVHPSGKTLLGLCTSPKDSPSWALCSGYITGFIEGAFAAGALCLPSQLTGEEAISAIVGASKSVSAQALDKIKDANRRMALSSLLAIAYPCERKK
jgi:hypothetical protein